MSIFGFSLFGWFGSQSSDIPSTESAENPLPPCPDSPNCIRITKQIDQPAEVTFGVSHETLAAMQPEEISIFKEQQKLKTVFKIFFFRDDMTVQVTKKTAIHAICISGAPAGLGKVICT